jgi:hypothetical protein
MWNIFRSFGIIYVHLCGIYFGHLEYILVIWYIFCPFGNFVAIWYIFHRFGTLCQESYGNPGNLLKATSQKSRGPELLRRQIRW